MIPMRTSTVFRNRWMALLWAAGIIWFASDFANSQPQAANASDNSEQAIEATGAPVSADDQQRLAAALKGF